VVLDEGGFSRDVGEACCLDYDDDFLNRTSSRPFMVECHLGLKGPGCPSGYDAG